MMLVGRVATGSGDLARWMTLYADAYAAIVGGPLYPGSLNLVLEEPWALPSQRITVSAEAVGRVIYLVPCSVGLVSASSSEPSGRSRRAATSTES